MTLKSAFVILFIFTLSLLGILILVLVKTSHKSLKFPLSPPPPQKAHSLFAKRKRETKESKSARKGERVCVCVRKPRLDHRRRTGFACIKKKGKRCGAACAIPTRKSWETAR